MDFHLTLGLMRALVDSTLKKWNICDVIAQELSQHISAYESNMLKVSRNCFIGTKLQLLKSTTTGNEGIHKGYKGILDSISTKLHLNVAARKIMVKGLIMIHDKQRASAYSINSTALWHKIENKATTYGISQLMVQHQESHFYHLCLIEKNKWYVLRKKEHFNMTSFVPQFHRVRVILYENGGYHCICNHFIDVGVQCRHTMAIGVTPGNHSTHVKYLKSYNYFMYKELNQETKKPRKYFKDYTKSIKLWLT